MLPFSPYTEPITFSGTTISTVVFVTIADLLPLTTPHTRKMRKAVDKDYHVLNIFVATYALVTLRNIYFIEMIILNVRYKEQNLEDFYLIPSETTRSRYSITITN